MMMGYVDVRLGFVRMFRDNNDCTYDILNHNTDDLSISWGGRKNIESDLDFGICAK